MQALLSQPSLYIAHNLLIRDLTFFTKYLYNFAFSSGRRTVFFEDEPIDSNDYYKFLCDQSKNVSANQTISFEDWLSKKTGEFLYKREA